MWFTLAALFAAGASAAGSVGGIREVAMISLVLAGLCALVGLGFLLRGDKPKPSPSDLFDQEIRSAVEARKKAWRRQKPLPNWRAHHEAWNIGDLADEGGVLLTAESTDGDTRAGVVCRVLNPDGTKAYADGTSVFMPQVPDTPYDRQQHMYPLDFEGEPRLQDGTFKVEWVYGERLDRLVTENRLLARDEFTLRSGKLVR